MSCPTTFAWTLVKVSNSKFTHLLVWQEGTASEESLTEPEQGHP